MSDTPRTDAAYFRPHATMYDLAGEMKRMERELKVASERIRMLEDELGDTYSEIRKHNSKLFGVFNYVVLQRAKEAKP